MKSDFGVSNFTTPQAYQHDKTITAPMLEKSKIYIYIKKKEMCKSCLCI